MLKKLLKYDLENNYKLLIVFYILSIFFAFLTRILFNIESSFIMNIIANICSGTTITMIINILINNLMRLWVRFKQNLYGDESYLTHTLPIKKETLYQTKILTTIITLFTSILVIGLTLFIAYYSKENIESIKKILLPIVSAYNSTIIKILLAFLLVFFLEALSLTQTGYTGIILGNRMNNNKNIFSIIFGFITYTATQIVALIIIFIIALFNKDLMNLFITNQMINLDMVKIAIYLSIFIYCLIPIIIYFINLNIFKKGVNVD